MKKIVVLMLVMAGLLISGCATPSQVLVNPDTGQNVRCAHSAWGWGLVGAVAISTAYASQSECIKSAKQMGYIEIEKFAVIGIRSHDRKDSSNLSKEVIILAVKPGSPASKVGIKVGDKIIERDGTPIKCLGDYMSLPYPNVGDNIQLKVDRNGEILIFNVKTIAASALSK
jgi:membrane-associated protease RseP (regulator of RpoE activity)